MKLHLKPLIRGLVGVAVGAEALPLPLWARMGLVAIIGIAITEGILPDTAIAQQTQKAIENPTAGPWT